MQRMLFAREGEKSERSEEKRASLYLLERIAQRADSGFYLKLIFNGNPSPEKNKTNVATNQERADCFALLCRKPK